MGAVKRELLEMVREAMRKDLAILADAAREAHAAATDPGSKAESKYDTRSLEASYLADGQARQMTELAAALRTLEVWQPPDFSADESADLGALVEVVQGNQRMWFLIAPAGGGLTVDWEGCEVTVLSPASPMSQKLIGGYAGEEISSGAVISRLL